MDFLIADFDDFSEKSNRLDLLFKLKDLIPNYKVTLFTCPGLCSEEFCRGVATLDWVELALHGDVHSELECSKWTKQQTLDYLYKYESWGCFKKVFRAPYWASSEEVKEALVEKGYILCENKKVEYGGKVYQMTPEISIHGHITNVCGNGLEEKFDYYKSLKNNYKFITTYAKESS
jgi:hypothetical protein